MDNPYSHAHHADGDLSRSRQTGHGFQWGRIGLWSLGMTGFGLLFGVGFGLLVAWASTLPGVTPADFTKLVYARIGLTGLLTVSFYAWFASGVPRRTLAHLVLLWLILQIADAVLAVLIFGVAPADLLAPDWLYARTLLWVLLAYGLVRLVRAIRAPS